MKIYIRVLRGALSGYVYSAKKIHGFYEADTEFGIISYTESEIEVIG